MKLTREADKTLSAVISMQEACGRIAATPITGEQDDITMAAKNRIAEAIRALDPGVFIIKTDSADVAKPLAESAVAPGECGSVPDEVVQKVRDAVAEALGGAAYDCTRVWSAWHVGTMSQYDFAAIAEDSDRVAEIADAAIQALQSASQGRAIVPVEPTWEMVEAGRSRILHKEYVGNVDMMLAYRAMIEVAQSGMSAPNTTGQPNEQNAVQTEQPSLSDKLALAAKHVLNHWNEFGPECGFDESMEMLSRALLAQRQDSDKLAVVHKFLLGEGPLDGFYFGDSDTARPRPAFWWRKFLRAAIANGAPK